MSKRTKTIATKPAWAPVSNPLLAAGMREIRSSNKSGSHADTRFRRARTNQALMLRLARED